MKNVWNSNSVIQLYCVLLSASKLQTLLKHMESQDVDLNAPNVDGDSPMHAIIRRKRRKRPDLLMTLLVNGCSRVDVNQCSLASGDTALHLAVMVGNTHAVIFPAQITLLRMSNYSLLPKPRERA